MKIGDIKPYEKNAKRHSIKQVNQVAASIKEFGFNQPIVILNGKTILWKKSQKTQLKTVQEEEQED